MKQYQNVKFIYFYVERIKEGRFYYDPVFSRVQGKTLPDPDQNKTLPDPGPWYEGTLANLSRHLVGIGLESRLRHIEMNYIYSQKAWKVIVIPSGLELSANFLNCLSSANMHLLPTHSVD